MTWTALTIAILAAGTVAIVVALARTLREPAPPATIERCETCGAPAPYELTGSVEAHEEGGWSAMVACYCKRHAPDGAVRVA